MFTVVWPPSRLIPAASNSIKAEVKENGVVIGSAVLPRPPGGGPTTATFNSLPVGSLTATATAYPNADGTGAAQATATAPLTIQASQTATITVTMASTIDHLLLNAGFSSIGVGGTGQLTVTARDLSNNIVLLSPSTVQWSSTNTNLATVNSSGLVTGVAPTGAGGVQINVLETESGNSAIINVVVSSGVQVSVNPPQPTLAVSDPQQFTATVTGSGNTAVTWSVQEGASGGTVTAGGLYTAPATPGTYHVIATSQADGTVSATATVTVQSGNANVTVK